MVSVRIASVIASFREGLKLVNNLKHMISLALFLTAACVEKGLVEDNPQESFANAREPYDQHNYDIAIKKLGEFKSRFPYSRYAIEAELLIANSQFELGKFAEAGVDYEQFAKLHPKHPQMDFALFRIGMAYWKDAPEDIDREQEYTQLAIHKWERLLKDYPQSPHTEEARKFIATGHRRIAESEDFVARYYCRQKIWHSCAYHSLIILEHFANETALAKEAVRRAAYALENLAREYDPNKRDKNLFDRDSNKEELLKKAEEFKERAKRL